MAVAQADDQVIVLSMLPAAAGQRRSAAAIALLTAGVFLAVVPFAGTPLPRIPAFIPCYETALIIIDLITASLLFGQFVIARSPALLVLACAYLFTASMTVVHALTFPGAFSGAGLLGAGPQTTAWLYMFWHGGFPLFVLAYAALETPAAGLARFGTGTAIVAAGGCVLSIVAALAAISITTPLPAVMSGHGYTSLMIFVVGTVWALCLAALLVLWRRKPHSVLDLWLMVVLCAWLCDVALSAMFNRQRFDLGFYAGRVYGLSAASVVLVILLMQAVTLYARLAQSLASERRERELRLSEMRSELLHVSRLNELGQMVSALAHEVRQPLAAISNYLQAGIRFMRSGNLEKAETSFAGASESVVHATRTIERVRDFVRKTESTKRVEDLAPAIEEAIALALVAAERKGVAVELRLHPEAPSAFMDKVQIQQVLLNLFRNAIEAMAEVARPALSIVVIPVAAGEIEVSVADNGPGLPALVREKLFQPFVTTKSSGLGVGLSICRTIVEDHDGRLWAEENVEGGAKFRFTLPRAKAGD